MRDPWSVTAIVVGLVLIVRTVARHKAHRKRHIRIRVDFLEEPHDNPPEASD